MPSERRDHGWAEREVGHEVPVHHVDVQPVGRAGDLRGLISEPAEVSRQDGWARL